MASGHHRAPDQHASSSPTSDHVEGILRFRSQSNDDHHSIPSARQNVETTPYQRGGVDTRRSRADLTAPATSTPWNQPVSSHSSLPFEASRSSVQSSDHHYGQTPYVRTQGSVQMQPTGPPSRLSTSTTQAEVHRQHTDITAEYLQRPLSATRASIATERTQIPYGRRDPSSHTVEYTTQVRYPQRRRVHLDSDSESSHLLYQRNRRVHSGNVGDEFSGNVERHFTQQVDSSTGDIGAVVHQPQSLHHGSSTRRPPSLSVPRTEPPFQFYSFEDIPALLRLYPQLARITDRDILSTANAMLHDHLEGVQRVDRGESLHSQHQTDSRPTQHHQEDACVSPARESRASTTTLSQRCHTHSTAPHSSAQDQHR